MAILMAAASFAAMAADEANEPMIPVEGGDITDIIKEDVTTAPATTAPATTAPATTAPEDKPLWGDVDGNGTVNINDVTALQNYFVRKIKKPAGFDKNADVNTDNLKNIYDATVIQLYLAGTLKKLPITPDGYYAELIRP